VVREVFVRQGVSVEAMLERGSEAPNFEVKDHTGRNVRLSDYRGRPVVLWFFSNVGAPGCATEGCGFRDRIARFDARGIQVFGIGFDTPTESAAFAGSFRLNFPLLCDTERSISLAYGVCDEPTARVGRRMSWVIGPDGRILNAYPKLEGAVQAEQVLQEL
jgi:thioredoxin-dependent peroxiredoxin